MESTETNIINDSSSSSMSSEDNVINKGDARIILNALNRRDNILNPFNYFKLVNVASNLNSSYKESKGIERYGIWLSNLFKYSSNITLSLDTAFGTKISDNTEKALSNLLASKEEVEEAKKEYLNFNLFGIRSATPKMDSIAKKIPTSVIYEIFKDEIKEYNRKFEEEEKRSAKAKKENPPIAKFKLTNFRNAILKHCELNSEEKNEINKMFKEAVVAKEGETLLSSLSKPFLKILSGIWPSKDEIKSSVEVTSTTRESESSYTTPVNKASLTQSVPVEVAQHVSSSVKTQVVKSPVELDYKVDILDNSKLDKPAKYKLVYQHVEQYLMKYNKAFSPEERQDLNTALTSAVGKFGKDTEQYKYLSALKDDCHKDKLTTLDFKEFRAFGDLRPQGGKGI